VCCAVSVPNASKSSGSRSEDLSRFTVDSDFAYADFAKRSPGLEIPTFRVQDYSWEDQGFSLANRLYSDIGNMLEDRFNIAFNLTYYT
jgi:sestrin